MGWGTNFYLCHYFSRKTYNRKSEVLDDLKEAEKCKLAVENELTQLAFITEPSKFVEEEYSVIEYLNNRLQELFEEYFQAVTDIVWLSELVESWDNCHDIEGLAIPNPDSYAYEKNYLDGDFVRTVEKKNTESAE